MMSLSEAGIQLFDCDHKTPAPAEMGFPYIAIPQIKEGRIDLTNVRYISQEDFVKWTKKTCPQPWDVILSRRCNPGETAYVPHELKCALGQNLVILRSNGSKVVPEFLRWLVRGPYWNEQVQTYLNVGAVFDSLKCRDIPNFRLPIPPLPEQRAIARVLGTLDDKIELNHRMNETLEAMARAIFKSLFVDFEPVHAKAEGRDTGLPEEIAELFPDSFEETELGEVPKGWNVCCIGDLAEVVGGSTPSTKEPTYWNGGIYYWTTPKDLSSLSIPVLLNTERLITDAGLSKISSGLLPKGTVLLSSRAPIGYLAVTEVPVAINQGFIAMKPKKGVSNLFILLWASSAHEDILSRANGSTFLEISKSNFRPIPVITPKADVMATFDKFVRPLYDKIVKCERESQNLTELRDTLLPKFITGEVQVNVKCKGEKYV